jgi:predicted TIM-barrel fold metal-dependent hydrolase
MIVDVHSHIFPAVNGQIGTGPTRSLGYGRIRFGDQETQLLPPYNKKTEYTPEMLVANMDWAGVDKVVLLQGTAYGECNDYARQALARYPDRLILAAFFDPWAEDNRAFFETIVERPGFRAVKLECSVAAGLCGLHPEARLDAAEIAWLWDEIERRGLLLVLDLGAVGSLSYQTGAVRAIAESHPDMRIVIAHLAQPQPNAAADPQLWCLWEEQIDLGLLPNVFFDNAALPAYLPDEDFPYPTVERYMRLAVERIGAHKIMWGTDQPGLLGVLSYPQLLRLAHLHTEFLSSAEQEMVLGGTAMQVYGS